MKLTPRQRQVANGIADGLKYAAIGLNIGVSEGTVRNYANDIHARATQDGLNPHGLPPRALITLLVRQHRANVLRETETERTVRSA